MLFSFLILLKGGRDGGLGGGRLYGTRVSLSMPFPGGVLVYVRYILYVCVCVLLLMLLYQSIMLLFLIQSTGIDCIRNMHTLEGVEASHTTSATLEN